MILFVLHDDGHFWKQYLLVMAWQRKGDQVIDRYLLGSDGDGGGSCMLRTDVVMCWCQRDRDAP